MGRLYACEALRPILRRARNPLMHNGSDSDCFARNNNDCNAIWRILIPPFPGSNPGAPASLSDLFELFNLAKPPSEVLLNACADIVRDRGRG